MKISWFKRNITPEIGTRVSGYGMEDVTFSKWSDLLMTGLLADDGERKVLLISFDLQCMDIEYIYKFRKLCGDILAIRSAGAYGEAMAFGYNCRTLPKGYMSDTI